VFQPEPFLECLQRSWLCENSHANDIRLSRAQGHREPKMPQWPVISELGNPEHSDNGTLSLGHCSLLSALTSLSPTSCGDFSPPEFGGQKQPVL
jgi:hypothetical protein